MNFMTDNKIFIDSNILVYLLEQDRKRRDLVFEFSNKGYLISTQVISENINTCLKKLKMTKEDSFEHGNYLFNSYNLVLITREIIKLAFNISVRYKYSYWDSMILATALENGCNTLYSEDMQHNQLIDEKLKIINPFL